MTPCPALEFEAQDALDGEKIFMRGQKHREADVFGSLPFPTTPEGPPPEDDDDSEDKRFDASLTHIRKLMPFDPNQE